MTGVQTCALPILQKYLDRLRDQATITWRNDELKKAYEQALAARRQRATAQA